MNLVADNLMEAEQVNGIAFAAALDHWRYCSPSSFLHHGRACCSIAREWLFATDHSQLNGEHMLMGPRWLRRKYDWGPSQWPMTWCQAVEQETLDCGALAALSREVFLARGVTCHAVQLIQQYTEDTAEHWFKEWTNYPASTHWIKGELIYHEACAVEVSEDEIRVWDPSSGWWANPRQLTGYGAIRAVRVETSAALQKTIKWGEHKFQTDRWHELHGPKNRPPQKQRTDVLEADHGALSLVEQALASAGNVQVELET